MVLRTHLSFLVIASLALTACQPQPSTTTTPGEIPLNADAQPGSKKLSREMVPELFDRFCYNNAPSFAGVRGTIAADGNFVQNPATGTYFHQRLNLSVKHIQDGAINVCSMVFASSEDNALFFIGPYSAKLGSIDNISLNTSLLTGLAENTNPDLSVHLSGRGGLFRLYMGQQ